MPNACTWTNRVWCEFNSHNLTRAYRDVLLTLATYRGAGGLICPAHATLADRASCSVRTVQRALALAAELGLVRWAERRVRAAWRWLRTSNRYWLLTPGEAVRPDQRLPWPRRATTGQIGRGGESQKKEADNRSADQLAAMLDEARRGPDLLALARARTEAMLAEQYARRRHDLRLAG